MSIATSQTRAPTAQRGQSLSREAVLTLVRDEPSSPLALTVAVQALSQAPGDQLLRLLFAARLAKVGLRTLAAEQLDVLVPDGPLEQQIKAMRSAVRVLPDDQLPTDALIAAASTAVMQLAGIGVVDHLALERFATAARNRRWFIMLDGSLVSEEEGKLDGLNRNVEQTRTACAKLTEASREYTRPLIVCGQSSVLTAHLALTATAAPHLGYTPRLWLVETETDALCESLAELVLMHEGQWPPELSSDRLEWHVGPQALEALRGDLEARMHTVLPDRVLAANSASARICTQVAALVEEAHAAQRAQLEHLHAEVAAAYARFDRKHWHEVFVQAASGQRSLRIAIVTSRFTTYVQHAARDLAAALERAGHSTRLIIEPDDHSNLAAGAYLHAFHESTPDLILAINYPRATLGAACPANVPFVCWVQDALSHLFNPDLGATSTQFDFLVGNLFNELFEKFGFPPARAMPTPVVADARKFNPAPVGAEARRRFECDVAFVSHQSETPQAMHDRLVASARTSAPKLAAIFERLRPAIGPIVERCGTLPINSSLRTACLEAMAPAGHADERTTSVVLRGYALPMADRLLRHSMLGAAQAICEKHDLTLGLYGKGWESHPTLAESARGPLDHGDDLRAAYQSAGVHLHISVNTLLHQRVLECFLSGGLCLCMDHRESLAFIKTRAQLELIRDNGDVVESARGSGEGGGRIGYSASNFAAARSLSTYMKSIGQPLDGDVVWIRPERIAAMRRMRPVLEQQVGMSALLADPAPILFTDPASLEQRVLSLVARPPARADLIAAVQANIHGALTHDALAAKMLRFIAQTLADPTESAA